MMIHPHTTKPLIPPASLRFQSAEPSADSIEQEFNRLFPLVNGPASLYDVSAESLLGLRRHHDSENDIRLQAQHLKDITGVDIGIYLKTQFVNHLLIDFQRRAGYTVAQSTLYFDPAKKEYVTVLDLKVSEALRKTLDAQTTDFELYFPHNHSQVAYLNVADPKLASAVAKQMTAFGLKAVNFNESNFPRPDNLDLATKGYEFYFKINDQYAPVYLKAVQHDLQIVTKAVVDVLRSLGYSLPGEVQIAYDHPAVVSHRLSYSKSGLKPHKVSLDLKHVPESLKEFLSPRVSVSLENQRQMFDVAKRLELLGFANLGKVDNRQSVSPTWFDLKLRKEGVEVFLRDNRVDPHLVGK